MTKQSRQTPQKAAAKNVAAKKVAVKRTAVTKRSVKRSAGPSSKRVAALAVSIFLLAVTAVIVIAMLASNVVVAQQEKARLTRIQEIYNNLDLGESYKVTSVDVFGEKRLYDWDASRSYSSTVEYVHGDSVINTVAELDAKIKAAGFAFIDEPYPGTKQVQYHYKSSDGEYIRLSVASKPYWDAVLNASAMNQDLPDSVRTMDTNAGPASITLKVNLDDNNE